MAHTDKLSGQMSAYRLFAERMYQSPVDSEFLTALATALADVEGENDTFNDVLVDGDFKKGFALAVCRLRSMRDRFME